ncbi:hypothetical protein [Thermotoga caldifontis]|uniref:hypothetical protein n=1 Tax=Thermotoga caldifontis TaxID=1508419 RepID=UPI0005977E78|nr:hypothetical protein [Thermotoga caldifontis]
MVEKWNHFPVYMWAGPGTIRINRVKFPGTAIDEKVHIEGGLKIGARRLNQMGYNWAYCTYNWGFPPEIEKEDHEYFKRTVSEYHEEGLKVFGYVQFSNVVFDGSHVTKRWYAMDQYGNKINYYSGRYLTCPTDGEWRQHLAEIVKGIVEAGADGVFFDNVFGSWFGFRPCYCDRCQRQFREFAEGLGFKVKGIPEYLSENVESRAYLIWRRRVLWDTLSQLSKLARSINPNVIISSNSFEACLSKLAVMAGVDLRDAFRVQDLVMIENHQLPRKFQNLQIFNTMTYRIAHAHSSGKPVTSVPYMLGIGADAVYPIRNYLQGMAEAYANDSIMVLKGTEYFHNGRWTLLTADEFENVRKQIADYHSWFKGENGVWKDCYGKKTGKIAIFHPYDSLTFHWERTYLPFFAAQHELIRHGIDYRVVWDNFDGVEILLVPPIFEETELEKIKNFGGKKIFLGYSPFGNEKIVWKETYDRLVQSVKTEEQLMLEQILSLLNFSAYFNDPNWRKRMEKANFLFFNYLNYCYTFSHPFEAEELIELVKPYQAWSIESDGFLIVSSFERDGTLKIHVVNLEDRQVNLDLILPKNWRVEKVESYNYEGSFVHRIYSVTT